jgi:Ser/Thr protein kinase RdoA (MazF antagonist)
MTDTHSPVVDAARSAWSLGDCPIRFVAQRENWVYRVETPQGLAALRLHRPGYRTIDQIASELEWMDMLVANGIAVPCPLPSANGQLVEQLDGTVVSMLTWVGGSPFSKTAVTPALYRSLGNALAKMHDLADAWQPSQAFSRPTWDLVGDNPTWGRFWENPGLSGKQASEFEAFRDAARQALADLPNLDEGLIHADLVPDNVLTDGDRLHLIDFDDGGYGARLFDLATITQSARRRFGRDDLAQAAVIAYQCHRQVEPTELHLFEALRSCSYVGWNMTRINETSGVERNERFISEAIRAIRAIRAIAQR